MTPPLEKQVCSLELSKRLKELGVPQDSLHAWSKKYHTRDVWTIIGGTAVEEWVGEERAAAFTVAELGEILGKVARPHFFAAYCAVMDLFPSQVVPSQMVQNLMTDPDIAAQMLAYLIENKLITL